VESGRALVQKVARILRSRGTALAFDELVSLGHQGLVEAAQSYEASFGVPFEAFAWTRVMGAMRNGTAKERKHRHRLGAICRAMEKATEFAEGAADDGDPFEDSDEVALARFRRSCDGFVAAAALGYLTAAGKHPEDVIADRDAHHRAADELKQAVSSLPERDQTLLDRHYRDSVDLIEIAREVRISRATVYRRHNAALARLAETLQREC